MRKIVKHSQMLVISRKELAEKLGLEVLSKSKITVEVHGDEASLVQQDEREEPT